MVQISWRCSALRCAAYSREYLSGCAHGMTFLNVDKNRAVKNQFYQNGPKLRTRLYLNIYSLFNRPTRNQKCSTDPGNTRALGRHGRRLQDLSPLRVPREHLPVSYGRSCLQVQFCPVYPTNASSRHTVQKHGLLARFDRIDSCVSRPL